MDLPRSERMTQAELAERCGLTQGAIHWMLKQARSVFVILGDDGAVELEEVVRLNKTSDSAA